MASFLHGTMMDMNVEGLPFGKYRFTDDSPSEILSIVIIYGVKSKSANRIILLFPKNLLFLQI